MIEAWSSGGFRTYSQLPGWTGPAWSLLLIPNWRQLIGAPLERIVAEQWAVTTRCILDDLGALPPQRWGSIRHETFIESPQAEILRLCTAMDLGWDRRLGASLPLARHTVSAPDAQKWRKHAEAIEAVASVWAPVEAHALSTLAAEAQRA